MGGRVGKGLGWERGGKGKKGNSISCAGEDRKEVQRARKINGNMRYLGGEDRETLLKVPEN